jgi:hypothetical protein
LTQYNANPVTSDMTSQEMWNLANLGYLPVRLVMGVSVYSLGLGFCSRREDKGAQKATLYEPYYTETS